MEFIDLQTVTDALRVDNKPNYVIDKVTIYGQIVKEMPRPMNIAANVRTEQGGKFAEMKLFGINLSYHARVLEESFKVTSKDYIYMMNGSILVFVPEEKIGSTTFVEIQGKIAQGKACNDYFSLLTWGKDASGWFIRPSKVTKSMLLGWNENTEHYMYAMKSIKEEKIIQPDDVTEQVEIFAYESNRRIKEKKQTTDTSTEDIDNLPEFNTKRVDFTKEDRSDVLPYSKTAEELSTLLEKAKTQKDRFIEALKKDYIYEDSCNQYLSTMLDNIKLYLKRKPNIAAMTGKAIVKKYLDTCFSKEASMQYLGTKLSNFMSDDFEEISEFVKDTESMLSFSDIAWELCKSAFTDREALYAGLLAVCIGKNPNEFVEIAQQLEHIDISFSKVVNINPYVLSIMTDMNFNQVEYIALCMGKAKDIRLELYRDIALLHDFTTNTNAGSTLFTINQLKYVTQIGVRLTKQQYDRCVSNNTYLTDTVGNNIVYFVNKDINPFYDISQFRAYGACYYKSMSYDMKDLALDNYIRSGLGIKYKNYITDITLLEKELYVYDFMHKMSSRKTGLTIEAIDACIEKFEIRKGFKLEQKQKEAVELMVNAGACIAGGAGSGKTTTSDCFVYVMNRLRPECDVQFGAPTGKAAKRMQEVLHKEVQTLHRKFKIGLNNSFSLFDDDTDTIDTVNVVYLFDEAAMIPLSLLYSIVKKLDPEKTSIYMFGDFNQLPPIGKGLPFRNLLRFMPSVFLNVSKRAKEGSTITLNADYVNECSDSDNWKYLENSGDFRLVPCASENIQRIVSGICKHYLGKTTTYEDNTILSFMHMKEFPLINGLSADDIQVVSPIGKATYTWGTEQLNRILQPIFNTNNGYSQTFCYYYSEEYYKKFVVGDRVIHTESNNYGMQWYSSFKDGVFHKMYGYGVSNGEVGKIVGFVSADSAQFYNEDEDKPEDFQYPGCMRRDDSYAQDNENGYFVVVEYTDYLTDRNFYILYRAEQSKKENNIGIALKGEDLGHLSLFYAGTTHKLQGSQAKLIISVLDRNDRLKTFLSRNMMYTIMTRATTFEFCIGSVDNTKDSMLSKARTVQAESGIMTVGELIQDETE